jgi:ubiquinol-cytochrome c reductase cytochrome b subunit
VFAAMYAWPAIERRVTGDYRRHDLLERPRDRPIRTAIGAAFLSWVVIVFAVGSTDRIFVSLHVSYPAQIHFWRVGIWVLPVIVFFLTRGVCRSLQRSGAHPLRAWDGALVARRADGAIEVLVESPEQPDLQAAPPGTAPGTRSRL